MKRNSDFGILGIDAAWMPANPSGVCLISKRRGRWTLIRLAPSVADFLSNSFQSTDEYPRRIAGGRIEAGSLIEACGHLGVSDVRVIAVDIPLSHKPIIGRRESDDAISRTFGKKKASTHSPTEERPGAYSAEVRDSFSPEGFSLATQSPAHRSLIEVYPHTAILSLLPELTERLEYKVSKTTKYWKGESLEFRKESVLKNHRRLLDALKKEIQGINLDLPMAHNASLSTSKPTKTLLMR